MSAPLHVLKQEHRVIERALRALDGICIRLEWGDSVPSSALAQLVAFLNEFADRFHHGKEETYLFPVLERRGIVREGGPLAAIVHQHETERELTAEMRHAFGDYQDLHPESRQHFVDAARSYTAHLIAHIQSEDSILFRLADEILEDTDIAALKEGFDRAEAEMTPRTRREYERQASELENTWSV
ncbi:MAG TPA: hemerythrin domain-containing protein [Blastocatellia bacterium]|nr:hemerythrin domain-containing protein [Blastocatellia bacterium]